MLGLLPFRLRIRIEVKLTTKKTVKATLNPISKEKSFSTISWAANRKKIMSSFLNISANILYNFFAPSFCIVVWYVNRNFRGKKRGTILIFILFVYWKTIKKWTRKMLVDILTGTAPFKNYAPHYHIFSVYNNRNYLHSN